uniref:Uncharacterized protein n=1 Tax=viral metagenome TaxID=1070528 RepID=A0A6C0DQJ0_9ZZZZ
MATRRKTRKNNTLKRKHRGGWKYNKSSTGKRNSKRGPSPVLTVDSKITGGECPCSKFFSKVSGGDANVQDAKNVIPYNDYSVDPQRMVITGNLPQTGGKRKSVRRRKCSRCGKKWLGGVTSLYGAPGAVSSFGTSPDMNSVSSSLFSGKAISNPFVYNQDSVKQSTIV